MERKLMICLIGCLLLCIPISYAISQGWNYRMDDISAFLMTQDRKNTHKKHTKKNTE